ncbi:MAG: DEAD/DEAH box helicase [Propionibacteriaceae bacterium]|jgi:ATP-dependent RNA helicase DeaD|nr:DEAD/DEAH box helicase [Propionibacteriaceae bacterium]
MTWTSPTTPPSPTFADLGLPDALAETVAALGYAAPTAIQAEAIPALLAGRDLIGVAQTGTGKTAAFGLPLLARLDPADRRVQALVLAPTRELALQDEASLAGFAAGLPGVTTLAVYGGAAYFPQKKALQRGVQVVVGTPGRILDHLDRGALDLSAVGCLVLDEGDEMLRMGFAEDVDRILDATPPDRQVALFSATLPTAIRRTAERHLHDPVEVAVTRPSSTVAAIDQRYAVVPRGCKVTALQRVLAVTDADAALVFVRTKAAADEVGAALAARAVAPGGAGGSRGAVAVISGDVPQVEREKIVARLRSGQIGVLVATDVAARGLDVDRVGLVVNFDLPDDAESYVHRVGRTGRAGRTGHALSFVGPAERAKLARIEHGIRHELAEWRLPRAEDVRRQRRERLLDAARDLDLDGWGDVRRAVEAAVTGPDRSGPVEQLERALDLATALAALAVGGPGADEGGADPEGARLDAELDRLARRGGRRDPGRKARADGHRTPAAERGPRTGARSGPKAGPRAGQRSGQRSGQRYWVGVGRQDGAAPRGIVGALTGEGGLRGADVGQIELFARHSIIEILPPLDHDAVRRLGQVRVNGRALRLRPDRSLPQKRPQRG